MRLTLRTLLAWLDDKLQPDQVSEIGKQVADSPLAQDLVERIQRVTRQRRLTVPSHGGPDSTDPNLVAGYLDNDIGPEQVAEYEKKCLSSDVNLAEAASVHQILSNLGQKVQVPPEARARMYLLVKGREAQARPARSLDGAAAVKHEPDQQTIDPWVVPPRPRRRVLERFGPIAAFVALFALLCWSAYESMKPGAAPPPTPAVIPGGEPGALADETPPADALQAPGLGALAPDQLDETRIAMSPPSVDEDDEAAMAEEPAPLEEADEDAQAKAVEADEQPTPDVPDGAVGVVAKVDGLLLRHNPESREWERIAEGSGVDALDRLLVLPPFRARVATGKAVLDLQPDTEVQITQRTGDEEPALDVSHGRVVIEPLPAETPIHVTFGGRALEVKPPAGASVGLEVLSAWRYGHPAGVGPVLAVLATEGETQLTMGETHETLSGPGAILAVSDGAFARPDESKTPEWLTRSAQPSAEESVLIENYLKQFSEDRPVLADIASATDSDDLEIKKLAISGLRALGDLSFLTPILDRPDDPDARQATIAALRDQLATGGALANRGWEQLQVDFGEFDRAWLQKLFLGFDDEDAASPKTYEELVQNLSSRNDSVGVRELAFDNLKRLSGRTTIPYNADDPETGHAAWKQLLDDGELRAAPK